PHLLRPDRQPAIAAGSGCNGRHVSPPLADKTPPPALSPGEGGTLSCAPPPDAGGGGGRVLFAPVKIAATAFVTSSLCFQAARSGKIVKSLTVLPHCASNLVRTLSSPGKAR